jgi:hypothetical protein
MKEGTIKIGVKGGFSCKVPIQEPETFEDLRSLSRGNPQVLARWSNRGYRIECQERSGARDVIHENQQRLKSGELTEAALTRLVAEKVAAFDPTTAAERSGRPRKPVVVAVKKGAKLTPEQFAELLAAQGVRVEFAESAS